MGELFITLFRFHLYQVSLSTKQDDFVILHVNDSYDSLLQIPCKTELVTTLKKLKEAQGLQLKVVCHDRYDSLYSALYSCQSNIHFYL